MRPALVLLLAALSLSGAREPDVETIFAPTGDRRLLEARISAEIARAQQEVAVAMFHFTSDRLVRALAERRRAGVAVRLILDAAQADEAFVRKLRDGGIDVRRAFPRGEGGARFHHKYAVLDGKIVVTGSYNWTVRGDTANHENVVILRHEAAARAFRENFEQAWNDKELSRP